MTRFAKDTFRRLLQAAVAVALLALPLQAQAGSRIKDIADFEGIRDNMLVGYGLVVGLDGTGDSLTNSPFTRQSLQAMLERFGVNIRDAANFRTANLAAVMVTATLPPFARHGSRLDVTISTMGDAKSLQGGTLLVTPLLGADGEVYSVAQGAVAISGFRAQGAAAQITRGTPTSGRIANGAIVEREVGFELTSLPVLRLSLKNPDLTTARRVSQAVSTLAGMPTARALDPSTVHIDIPERFRRDVVGFMTEVEQLQVETDQMARVVIDERSGTIVMGPNVRIDTVAIAQGSLTVRITETPQVSQPLPFSPAATAIPGIAGSSAATGTIQVPRIGPDGQPVRNAQGNFVFDTITQAVPGTGTPTIPGAAAGGAQTVVVPRTDIQVDDQNQRRLGLLPRGVSLQELVDGLNALGVGPRDMITILQAIKAAGALQAEIQVM
ncbi:flagellar basal body P-ring protein FlgI [Ferrovibrio terrae]|uniref:flagellar basal body P-ring protein FlgI n=1 Tax=Ferrovibrio terrae TaxID=2594003 RepID=UPI00163DE260|nr:flagellar basal body P-ring protein FlgI [Ferrovibrio terrae]